MFFLFLLKVILRSLPGTAALVCAAVPLSVILGGPISSVERVAWSVLLISFLGIGVLLLIDVPTWIRWRFLVYRVTKYVRRKNRHKPPFRRNTVFFTDKYGYVVSNLSGDGRTARLYLEDGFDSFAYVVQGNWFFRADYCVDIIAEQDEVGSTISAEHRVAIVDVEPREVVAAFNQAMK